MEQLKNDWRWADMERLTPVCGALAVLLAACGDDGNADTIWTGLSGVVIVAVIIWLLWRIAKRRG